LPAMSVAVSLVARVVLIPEMSVAVATAVSMTGCGHRSIDMTLKCCKVTTLGFVSDRRAVEVSQKCR
jgi:uncharacterized membrane protein